jgi:hypothetical protein
MKPIITAIAIAVACVSTPAFAAPPTAAEVAASQPSGLPVDDAAEAARVKAIKATQILEDAQRFADESVAAGKAQARERDEKIKAMTATVNSSLWAKYPGIKIHDQFKAALEECKLTAPPKEDFRSYMACGSKALAFSNEANKKAKIGTVRLGMNADQVINSRGGFPVKINTTETKGRISEQWVYDSNTFVYLTNGRVTAIQN